MSSEISDRSPASPVPAEDARYRAARQKAEARQGLYIHLIIFTLVNAALFGINAVTRGQDGNWWFYWPLLVWGIGVTIHLATVVFGVFSPDWQDREAQRILARGARAHR